MNAKITPLSLTLAETIYVFALFLLLFFGFVLILSELMVNLWILILAIGVLEGFGIRYINSLYGRWKVSAKGRKMFLYGNLFAAILVLVPLVMVLYNLS